MPRKRIDLIGQKFGRWGVLEFAYSNENHTSFWKCQCDCGVVKNVSGETLRRGDSKSCGCLSKELREKPKTNNGYSGLTRVMIKYRNSAKYRGLNFMLSRDEFEYLTQQNCHYCNGEPSNVGKISGVANSERAKERSKYVYNGIDRVNSSKGYTKENSVPCCKTCNYAKSNMSEEKFMEWIERLTYFQLNKKKEELYPILN